MSYNRSMTKRQYLEARAFASKIGSDHDIDGTVREIVNPRKKEPRRQSKGGKLKVFVFHLPTGSRSLQAFTKSEARAMLKQQLGVERLPAGLVSGRLQ